MFSLLAFTCFLRGCFLFLQASGGSSLDKKRIISTDRHIVKVMRGSCWDIAW
jgi:hypothetical protein